MQPCTDGHRLPETRCARPARRRSSPALLQEHRPARRPPLLSAEGLRERAPRLRRRAVLPAQAGPGRRAPARHLRPQLRLAGPLPAQPLLLPQIWRPAQPGDLHPGPARVPVRDGRRLHGRQVPERRGARRGPAPEPVHVTAARRRLREVRQRPGDVRLLARAASCATPDAYRGRCCHDDADCTRDEGTPAACSQAPTRKPTRPGDLPAARAPSNGTCTPRGGFGHACSLHVGRDATPEARLLPRATSGSLQGATTASARSICRAVDGTSGAGYCTDFCAAQRPADRRLRRQRHRSGSRSGRRCRFAFCAPLIASGKPARRQPVPVEVCSGGEAGPRAPARVERRHMARPARAAALLGRRGVRAAAPPRRARARRSRSWCSRPPTRTPSWPTT